jgi:hypothetical protein
VPVVEQVPGAVGGVVLRYYIVAYGVGNIRMAARRRPLLQNLRIAGVVVRINQENPGRFALNSQPLAQYRLTKPTEGAITCPVFGRTFRHRIIFTRNINNCLSRSLYIWSAAPACQQQRHTLGRAEERLGLLEGGLALWARQDDSVEVGAH